MEEVSSVCTTKTIFFYVYDVEIAKYLLEEKDANIHAVGDSPVCLAAVRGHVELVKYLVERVPISTNLFLIMPLCVRPKGVTWTS